MTIGQRIAQRRKELGLSQEALGQQLGVSRQSIYKWESDTALPDIDKLIALSRLFSVTVGWLLGVETPAEPEGTPPEAAGTSGELTDAQLKIVEEIVSRYIAAQAKPVPPRRRLIFKAAVGAAAVCLVFSLFNLFQRRLDQLDQRYSQVQSSVNSISSNVSSQINGISSQVEEILKSQNSLTADYGAEILRADLAANSVTFSLYAVPKTFVDGMTAEFYVYNGSESTSKPSNPVNQKFSAEITCELTDSITLSVVFVSPDGTRQTQLLTSFYDLYTSTLPSVYLYPIDGGDLLFLEQEKDGTLRLPAEAMSIQQTSSSVSAVNDVLGTAAIQDIRVGLFLNWKLVAWTDATPPDGWIGDDPDSYFLDPITVQMAPGDQLCFAAVVTDEYGRDSVYCDVPYVLEDGELTWLDAADLSDHDPSRWTY